MTIPVANVNVIADTFGAWVQKTNQIADIVSANAVTVDATTTGSISTGNGFVNGIFSATTIATNTLRGGNVAVSNTLVISSNVIIDGTLNVNGTISYDVLELGTSLIPITNNVFTVGNTGNVFSQGYITTIFANVVHAYSNVVVGNVNINTTAINIGTGTINSTSYSGTSNNATYLGGALPSAYVNATGNYTFTGIHTHEANVIFTTAGIIANSSGGTSGQVLASNGSGGLYWTNSVQIPSNNTQVIFNDSNTIVGTADFTFDKTTNKLAVTGSVNSASFNVGSVFTANTTGVNAAAFNIGSSFNANTTAVNAAAFTISTSFRANTTGVYHTGLVNAAAFNIGSVFNANTTVVNAASFTISTSFRANTTGVYHTGTINAASFTVGTAFNANSTAVNVASIGISTNTLTIGTSVYFVSNGNVGIGNTTPTDKLKVNGSIADSIGNVRDLPIDSKITTYTLASTDAGKMLSTNAGITVNGGLLSPGFAVTIFNNSAASITVTQSVGTIYLSGTSTTGNRTLAQRTLATIVCVAANTFVIGGGGVS